MTPEIIDDYKKELLLNIEAEMKDEGKVSTFMQILGEKEGIEKPVIIHIVTEFHDEENKDFFVEEVIPTISKKLKKNQITPHYVVFVSEVWVTKVNKESGNSNKEEAVLIAYSSESGENMEAYNIIRHAYEVDDKGELSSKVDLVKDEDLTAQGATSEGRFSNLYRTLMKEFNK